MKFYCRSKLIQFGITTGCRWCIACGINIDTQFKYV